MTIKPLKDRPDTDLAKVRKCTTLPLTNVRFSPHTGGPVPVKGTQKGDNTSR
jgi:hypothetical protein